MISSTCIHVVTVGGVSATVHQGDDEDGNREFDVVVEGCRGNSAFFHMSQLSALRAVIEQAETFIRRRQQLVQISRTGCGASP